MSSREGILCDRLLIAAATGVTTFAGGPLIKAPLSLARVEKVVRQGTVLFSLILALLYHYTLYELERIDPEFHGLKYSTNTASRRQTTHCNMKGTEPMKSKGIQHIRGAYDIICPKCKYT